MRTLSNGLTLQQIEFIDYYMKNPESGIKAAVKAGYGGRNAAVRASVLLSNVNVRREIERRLEEKRQIENSVKEWTLDRSLRESISQYNRYINTKPDVAYRFKENADKLMGLLVEKTQDVTEKANVRTLNTEAERALSGLTVTGDGIASTVAGNGAETGQGEAVPVQAKT